MWMDGTIAHYRSVGSILVMPAINLYELFNCQLVTYELGFNFHVFLDFGSTNIISSGRTYRSCLGFCFCGFSMSEIHQRTLGYLSIEFIKRNTHYQHNTLIV